MHNVRRCHFLVSLLCLAALAGCSPTDSSQIPVDETTVNVPDTAGMNELQAREAIVDAGLRVATVTTQPSDDVAMGEVLRTEPRAGSSITSGSSVAIVLSSGSADVSVPATAGASQSDAEMLIINAGLQVGATVLEVSNAVPAGQVIRTSPAAGSTVARNTSVTIIRSSGPADVSVPNVLNLEEAIAVSDIEAAGLAAGDISGAPDSVVPFGRVLAQDPVAGVMVSAATPIDIVVSLGPENIMVPDVLGLTEVAAGDAISAAGLVIGEIATQPSVDMPAGDVIAQQPPGGTLVALTTTVDLLVSLGPNPVPLPNIVGLSETQAIVVLTNAGIVPGVVNRRFDNSIPQGQVISQSTPPGTVVSPGTPLDFVVSLGAPIDTPDVAGLTLTDASDAIVAANLVVGDITEVNDELVPAETVISQDPAAGTAVSAGSVVNLVVSLGPVPATGSTRRPD